MIKLQATPLDQAARPLDHYGIRVWVKSLSSGHELATQSHIIRDADKSMGIRADEDANADFQLTLATDLDSPAARDLKAYQQGLMGRALARCVVERIEVRDIDNTLLPDDIDLSDPSDEPGYLTLGEELLAQDHALQQAVFFFAVSPEKFRVEREKKELGKSRKSRALRSRSAA